MTGRDLANQLTSDLLVEIPKRFPGCRVWRRNVGVAVGLETVHKAIAMLRVGQIKEAIALLLRRPITFGVPGEPDIDGVMPVCLPTRSASGLVGLKLSIEVKAGTDTIKPNQKLFGDMLISKGALYLVARTKTQALADLREMVNRI